MSKRTRRKNLRESILPECAEFAAAYKNTGAAGRYDLYKGAKTIKSSIVDSGLYVCENDFVADVFDVLFKNKTDETKGMYEDEKRKIYNDVETTFHYVKNYEEFVQEVKSSVGKAMAKSIIQMAGEKINLKGSPDTIMKAMPPDESSPEETKAEDGEETEEGTKNEADSGDAVEKENKVGVFSSVFSFFFGSSVASKEEVPTGATSVKDHFAEFTRLEK